MARLDQQTSETDAAIAAATVIQAECQAEFAGLLAEIVASQRLLQDDATSQAEADRALRAQCELIEQAAELLGLYEDARAVVLGLNKPFAD